MDRHKCTDTMSGATFSSALHLSWHGWLEDGKNLVVAELQRAPGAVMTTAALWYHRARSRRQLLKLDARMREDIGMTARQVQHEAAKCFWES